MVPVLLLHGYPFDGRLWDPVRPGLVRAGLRPVAPDLPGFGRAQPLAEAPATVDDFARAVLDVADSEGFATFVVVGHSFGGYVALALAALAPQRLTALGLVSTQAGPDGEDARKGRHASIERVRKEGTAFLGPTMTPKLAAPGHAERVTPLLDPFFARIRPDGVVAALHAMASRPDRMATLQGFDRPVAIVHGDADALVPIAKAEAMAKAAARATFTRLPGVGHLPMLETPDATARAIAGLAA